MQDAIFKLVAATVPVPKVRVPVTVPTGVRARSPLTFEGRLTLQEPRRIVPQLASKRTDGLALAILDDLFRRPRRRPLWAC